MVTTAMYLQIPSDGLLQEDARHFSDPIPFPEIPDRAGERPLDELSGYSP